MILSYHKSPPEAWQAMLDACENARDSIYIEEYVLEPDRIGSRFIKLLCIKAREGIDVRLLLDWWGCLKLAFSQQLQQLKDAGVKVQFYRSPGLKWFSNGLGFFPRDHRKTLIVDGTEAFIGGVCIYDKITDWRDSMLRVNSTIAPQILYVFEQTWKKAVDDETAHKAHPDFETDDNYSIFANAPDSNENYFSDWLIDAITNAKEKIQLTTPYFTPGRRLMPALKDALHRGVEVQILLSDYSKVAPYVVDKHCCGELIGCGAKIYYYQPPMLHLKMMIIDEECAAIGSCNLDGLSIHQNQEIMLVTKDKQSVDELLSHFKEDLSRSFRFHYDDWQVRPIWEKLLGYALQPFKHYL